MRRAKHEQTERGEHTAKSSGRKTALERRPAKSSRRGAPLESRTRPSYTAPLGPLVAAIRVCARGRRLFDNERAPNAVFSRAPAAGGSAASVHGRDSGHQRIIPLGEPKAGIADVSVGTRGRGSKTAHLTCGGERNGSAKPRRGARTVVRESTSSSV